MNSVNKVIKEVFLFSDKLTLVFEDESKISFEDDGQSRCEHRYMSNDGADLREYVGSRYIGYSVKDAPEIECEYGYHEVQFLEIMTSYGAITMSMHNEHNGYYGGISLTVTEGEVE